MPDILHTIPKRWDRPNRRSEPLEPSIIHTVNYFNSLRTPADAYSVLSKSLTIKDLSEFLHFSTAANSVQPVSCGVHQSNLVIVRRSMGMWLEELNHLFDADVYTFGGIEGLVKIDTSQGASPPKVDKHRRHKSEKHSNKEARIKKKTDRYKFRKTKRGVVSALTLGLIPDIINDVNEGKEEVPPNAGQLEIGELQSAAFFLPPYDVESSGWVFEVPANITVGEAVRTLRDLLTEMGKVPPDMMDEETGRPFEAHVWTVTAVMDVCDSEGNLIEKVPDTLWPPIDHSAHLFYIGGTVCIVPPSHKHTLERMQQASSRERWQSSLLMSVTSLSDRLDNALSDDEGCYAMGSSRRANVSNQAFPIMSSHSPQYMFSRKQNSPFQLKPIVEEDTII